MGWIILTLLIVVIITVEDKILHLNTYSPAKILVVPTFTLMVLTTLLNSYTKFIPISDFALQITALGVLCFWIGGMILTLTCNKKQIADSTPFKPHAKSYKFIFVLSIICILAMMLNLKSLLAGRALMQLEDQEFAQNGIIAHIGNFIVIFTIFYVASIFDKGFNISKKTALIMSGLCLALKMASAVKGQVILPIIGGVLYLLVKKYIKLNTKIVLSCFAVVFIMFTLPALMFNLGDDGSSFEFVIDYFLFYLFCGVTGLSAKLAVVNLHYPDNPRFIYTFFYNFYQKFFGTGVLTSSINSDFVLVTTSKSLIQHGSNVYTMIGEVYINCGYFIGCIFLTILGAYSYMLFHNIKKHPLLLILYVFVAAALCLNFFSQYIFSPTFYVCQVFCLLLYFVSRVKTD